jgi:hypothetical protein
MEAQEGAMADKLTWDEIKAMYPDEWVALTDVEWPDMGAITAGVVYAHSSSRAELLQQQKHLKSAAILWTGKKRGVALMAAVDVDR